jgi:hypothetical protein
MPGAYGAPQGAYGGNVGGYGRPGGFGGGEHLHCGALLKIGQLYPEQQAGLTLAWVRVLPEHL